MRRWWRQHAGAARWFAAPVVLVASVAFAASAQDATVRTLGPAIAEFAEPFSDLSQVVELADGRVLVYDAIERHLGIADFRDGSFRAVARQGAGPAEYRRLLAALRVAGDSILLWDAGNDRVLALAPDGTPAGPWPTEGRTPRGIALIRAHPRERDARGQLFAAERAANSDTTALVRIDLATGRRDTLARSATPQLRPRRTSTGTIAVTAPGLPPIDGWAVFPDGRVLLVHGDTYVPELLLPDGTRRRVAAIPFTPVAVSSALRARHVEDVRRVFLRRLGQEAGGGRGMTLPQVRIEEPASWPERVPPLRDAVIRVDARERAWVPLAAASDASPERFDLLDKDGTRVGTVHLPPGVQVVAFGRDVVYGAFEDDDGLLHLRRYALPR